MSLFIHDDDRCLMPTAKHIWDQLLTTSPEIYDHIGGADAQDAFGRLITVAETHGKVIYDDLLLSHRDRLIRESEKGEYAFAARRRVMERIGLPSVRNHRLAQLAQEERVWREQLEKKAHVSPEMAPLLLIRLEGSCDHG